MSPNQKFLTTIVGIVAGVVVLVYALMNLGKVPSRIEVSTAEPANRFSVSAEGKVTATPDVAVVRFGLVTEKLTVAQATAENTERMNAVIRAIKDRKVEEKDIKTTMYQLNPVYEYPRGGKPTIRGYSLNQQVMVKIRDFDTIGEVIAAATDAGANEVGSLEFSVDDPESLRAEARKEAIGKAADKAKEIAKESGLRLGSLLNVSESGSAPPMPMYARMDAVAFGVAESAPAPDIQAGEQEITVTVTLTYDVE